MLGAAVALWAGLGAVRACLARPAGKRSPKAASAVPAGLRAKLASTAAAEDDAPPHAVSALPAGGPAGGVSSIVGDSEPLYTPPQGWVIPGVVLWSGYLLNLVPYMGISRSKFVYHYIPALMVAVLLAAYALEAAWCAAVALSPPASQRRAALKGAATLLTLAWFGVVAAGFWYWCIPFGYGQSRLPWDQVQARKWNAKW